MRKKKIIIQTNNPMAKTGLAENGRYLMEYLLKNCADKYEVIYYCTQTHNVDPVVRMLPCKAYGCIPSDQQTLQQLNQDPGKARDVAYGSYYIDEIIKNEKPDILLMSDDIWSFNGYYNRKWAKKINSIYHITVDSRPILEEAYKQAESTKTFFTWAEFAAKEIKKKGEKYQHVKNVYGMFDTKDFSPISKTEKSEWRKKFGISDDTTIFLYLSRNQLRKSFPAILQAFAEFKKNNPNTKAKLFFHTSFSEKGSGWDIPKLMEYYGISKEDVLATYICKKCGQWEVKPYDGEDLNCKFCGAEKTQITTNIALGVPDKEMKYLHGIADATINAFTSGGQERSVMSSLLCGLPTAVTNYSCGEDYCEQSFVFPLNWYEYFEPGTNFTKAGTSVKSILGFMEQIVRMDPDKKQKITQQGLEWARKTFSVETIGKQWEEIFDSCPFVDLKDSDFEDPVKNPNFELPQNWKEMDDDSFITLLYKNILLMDEPVNGDGHKHWKDALNKSIPREQIIDYFRKVANEETAKNKKSDFWELIDKNGKNRALFVIKESIGDAILCTSLFESLHEQYPNTDLYVACDPKFFEVFEGNPYIYRLLPYQQFMENELAMTGAGQKIDNAYFDYFFHPAIGTQRLLNYLSITNNALQLT